MSGKCRNRRILWVDLETETVEGEILESEIYRNFIGGKGLGAFLLYRTLQAGVNPLSPDNVLFFLTGPLQALKAPSVGRWTLVTKSPLTGLFLDTHCGGPLGREIKKAGYDVLGVRGKAAQPLVLFLTDGDVHFEKADQLWGMGVYQATKTLHEKYGTESAVYTIGPAGENLVPIATGCCEIAHQTGRGGAGAVMGSKNLKAIVAHGTKSFEPADPEELQKVNREVAGSWKQNTTGFPDIGTGFLVPIANELGQFPTRNWDSGFFELHEQLNTHLIRNQWKGRHHSCPQCIMRCTHTHSVQNPDNPDEVVESAVEYETLGLMGGNLGIADLNAVLQLNYLCDDLGLDTISAGVVIGFVMDACKNGIISEKELGFNIAFGDVPQSIRLLKMIASREGLGEILCQGVRKTTEKIGKGTEKLAVHVKGLECAAWDPRGRKGMGLSYATAEVGASHLRGWPATTDPPDSTALDLVESMIRARDEKVLTDSLIVCHFTYHLPLKFEQKIRLLNAATGLDYAEQDIFEFAQRVATLTRLFNVREGINRKDDKLPPRFWIPQSQGPRKGLKAFVNMNDFNACLDRFYELRGWNKEGIPTDDTIKQLGLAHLVHSSE